MDVLGKLDLGWLSLIRISAESEARISLSHNPFYGTKRKLPAIKAVCPPVPYGVLHAEPTSV